MGMRAVGWLAACSGRGWLSSGAESSRRRPSDASPLPGSGQSSGPSSPPLTSGNVLQSPGPQPPAPHPVQGPAVFLSCSEPVRLQKEPQGFSDGISVPSFSAAEGGAEDPGLGGPARWAGAGRDSKLPLDPSAGPNGPRARDLRPSGAPLTWPRSVTGEPQAAAARLAPVWGSDSLPAPCGSSGLTGGSALPACGRPLTLPHPRPCGLIAAALGAGRRVMGIQWES